MDPTIGKQHESGKKYKFKIWLDKITRIIWYVFVTVIIIQIVLIGYKMLAPAGQERMCWEPSMCFNYCELAKQKRCIEPEKHDTTLNESWALLLTGKRNIVELLNDGQKYCGCELGTKDETRIETFYQYYTDNK